MEITVTKGGQQIAKIMLDDRAYNTLMAALVQALKKVSAASP